MSKCASHFNFAPHRRKFCSADRRDADSGSESDEDNNSLIKSSSSMTKRLKESTSQQLNNLDNPCKSKAENDMIRLAGGAATAESIALQCENMLKSGGKRLEPRM